MCSNPGSSQKGSCRTGEITASSWHPLGTKRPSLEQDCYKCLDEDNVHLVDLKNNGIKRSVAEGVDTEDGIVHKFDTVVLATGYDAITGSFTGMELEERQGVDLREK